MVNGIWMKLSCRNVTTNIFLSLVVIVLFVASVTTVSVLFVAGNRGDDTRPG